MAIEAESGVPENKFRTPEEELTYLRDRLSDVERRIDSDPGGSETSPTDRQQQVVREYSQSKPEDVLHKSAVMSESTLESVVLDLAPEEHDSKMSELLGIMQEKGVRNALSVVSKLGKPHIEDDFHRFIVEYLKEGYKVQGLREKGPVWRSLNRTLFEVTVPTAGKDDEQKELKQLLSSMEQFYSGMMSLSTGPRSQWDHLTLEIATSVDQFFCIRILFWVFTVNSVNV